MNIINVLKKIADFVEQKQNNMVSYPVKKQKEYISYFSEPKDDIERSFFQYKCQMKLYSPTLSFAINLISFPVLLVLMHKVTDEKCFEGKIEAIAFLDGKPRNIIPDEITARYLNILYIEEKKESFTKKDKQYLMMIWKRYPFSWHFLLKCLIKIRYYSYEINRGKPESIIVCNEYSFTSSMLTDYCHLNGVRHINVMHGEKWYYIRDSFFHFDECYVWNKFYRDLFIKLKAEKSQFIISKPQSLYFVEKSAIKERDYTYYLDGENDAELKLIKKELTKLSEKGNRIAIRPHPRYSNIEKVHGIFDSFDIEDTKKLSIEKSILRTKNVIARYSTVLFQAYCNDVDIIIDDMTTPEYYKKLQELEYIVLNYDHKLLSKELE